MNNLLLISVEGKRYPVRAISYNAVRRVVLDKVKRKRKSMTRKK